MTSHKMAAASLYLLPVCLLLLLLLLPDVCVAFPYFQKQIPNGDSVPSPCQDHDGVWMGVGHVTPSGGSDRNQFGLDFEGQGKKWTKALCEMDSDGDGQSNGQELGDPDCSWTPGKEPSRDATSHPGICEPLDSALCHNKTRWLSCQPETPLHCDHVDYKTTTNIDVRLSPVRVPSSDTTYMCQMFDLDLTSDSHMIATLPLVATEEVVHHMLLFGCDNGVTQEKHFRKPYECVMIPHDHCRKMIGGWTVGSLGQCAHPDMGFRIGTKGFQTVALQVHFNNPRRLDGLRDASGFRMVMTEHRRPHDASMFVVGQRYMQIDPVGWREPMMDHDAWTDDGPDGGYEISSLKRRSISKTGVPMGKDRVAFTSVCPTRCTEKMVTKPIKITAAINHMHYLGISQRIEIYRNGKFHKVITDQHDYSFHDPVIYTFADPIVVEPGDELRTTCVYKRPNSSQPVCWGEAASDEMCFGFLTYFPTDGLKLLWCSSMKSMPSCDRHLLAYINGKSRIEGCEWWTFRNISHPETRKIFGGVLSMCYDAKHKLGCSSKCRELVRSIASHPCLQNDIGSYMIDKMKNYGQQGRMFVDALITCSCQNFQTCERRLPKGSLGTLQKQFCSGSASFMTSSTFVLSALLSLLSSVTFYHIIINDRVFL